MSERSSDQVFNEPVDSLMPREGLPRQYRMRADRHYVDQLAASSSGQPVRMILVSEIDAPPAASPAALRPLIESIRLRGMVQPLLVRRRDARYQVVAGRKRLLAALTLQLPTVPCLVHDLSDAEADDLAAADNIRVAPSDSPDSRRTDAARFGDTLAVSLKSIAECARLCERGAGLRRPALDLLNAHIWRASRLVDAFRIVNGGPMASSRPVPLAAIIAAVVEGFEEESRLSGVSVETEVSESVSAVGVSSNALAAGVAGALFAVLPLVEHAARPKIVLRVFQRQGGELAIELIQTCVPIAPYVAEHFFDGDASFVRPGDCTASLGAQAAKALAGAHDGEATFEALPNGGRLLIVLRRCS